MNVTEILSEFQNINLAGITLNKVLSAVLLLAVCLAVVKLLLKAVDKVLQRTEIERSLHTFVRTTAKVVLLFLTVLIVAGSIGIPVTSLIAVLSVAGLAVSLAVQNCLSNVAGGIQVLTSRPFKVGDYVEAGGIEGIVNDIGIFYTRINTWDNKVIQVPNSTIAGEKIINYTAEEKRRVDLTFSVAYSVPLEDVKRTAQRVMEDHPMTLSEPNAPFVRVSKYGESAIEYAMRVWCATEDYWTVYYDMLEQIKGAFDKAGVTMTYPHLNVHVVEQ